MTFEDYDSGSGMGGGNTVTANWCDSTTNEISLSYDNSGLGLSVGRIHEMDACYTDGFDTGLVDIYDTFECVGGNSDKNTSTQLRWEFIDVASNPFAISNSGECPFCEE